MVNWTYKKTDKGYIINRTGEDISLSFCLPKRQEFDNGIMFWNDKKIKELIDGLNDGSIPFHMDDELKKRDNLYGYDFSFTIPKTKIQFDETLKLKEFTL